MSVSRNPTLRPRKILLPVTIPHAATRLVAAVIAAQTVAAIVVETAVEIAAVGAVAVGAVVVPEVAVVVAIVVDITMARVDAICRPQNMHRRKVIAILAATITAVPTIVSPALPWTRPKTISFCRVNRSLNIAAVPCLLP